MELSITSVGEADEGRKKTLRKARKNPIHDVRAQLLAIHSTHCIGATSKNGEKNQIEIKVNLRSRPVIRLKNQADQEPQWFHFSQLARSFTNSKLIALVIIDFFLKKRFKRMKKKNFYSLCWFSEQPLWPRLQ